MPFPWKKAKGKRFSQLVSNHLQPPKRGSSLILETGFPASLADLFVKNRDRFNNYTNANNIVVENKKKKKNKRTSPHAPPISIPPPSFSPSPSPSLNPSNLSTPSRVFCVPLIPSPRPCGEDVVVVHDRTDREVVDGKNVSLMVLKMFFVVLMALCAKRFSVGIAISAFLLLFIEYVGRLLGGLVGKSASVRWVSCCLVGLLNRDEKLGVEASIQVIRLGSEFEAPIQETKLDSDLDSSKGSLDYSRNKIEDLVSGIDVVQPSPNLVPPIREIPSVMYEINLRNGKEIRAEKVGEEVIEKLEQEECVYPTLSKLLLSEGKNERATRKSTIKSKIKTLANKLNGSKSKHKKKNLNGSKCDENGMVNVVATNQDDKEREVEEECDGDSPLTSSSSSAVNFYNDRVNIEESICSEDSSNNSKNFIEERERERKSSSGGYLAILVIVLAGLVGGRVLALVFALLWFLILKFGSGTRLRCITN